MKEEIGGESTIKKIKNSEISNIAKTNTNSDVKTSKMPKKIYN